MGKIAQTHRKDEDLNRKSANMIGKFVLDGKKKSKLEFVPCDQKMLDRNYDFFFAVNFQHETGIMLVFFAHTHVHIYIYIY